MSFAVLIKTQKVALSFPTRPLAFKEYTFYNVSVFSLHNVHFPPDVISPVISFFFFDCVVFLLLTRPLADSRRRMLTVFRRHSFSKSHVDPSEWKGGVHHGAEVLCAAFQPPQTLVTGLCTFKNVFLAPVIMPVMK